MSSLAHSNHLRTLPLRWRAGRRRTRGLYDRSTLHLFRRSSRNGDVRALLDYVLFRRDLGHALHPRFVPTLLAQHGRLTGKRRWQAAALLAEIDSAPEWFWHNVPPGPGIATAAPNQQIWRAGFSRTVRAAASKEIFVVGNAGSLVGTKLGERIDAADLVVRFNHCGGEQDRIADVGERLSVWVTSPAYRGPHRHDAEWVAVTGPDMCFRMRRWGELESRMRQARPVLTVPLGCWRELVTALGAPPSAGVLMLAWLRRLLGSWQGITTAGVGVGDSTVLPYHQAGRRLRGSSRHHWAAEAALVRRWSNEGLLVLPLEAAQ